jgi:hypothetical protein
MTNWNKRLKPFVPKKKKRLKHKVKTKDSLQERDNEIMERVEFSFFHLWE